MTIHDITRLIVRLWVIFLSNSKLSYLVFPLKIQRQPAYRYRARKAPLRFPHPVFYFLKLFFTCFFLHRYPRCGFLWSQQTIPSLQ